MNWPRRFHIGACSLILLTCGARGPLAGEPTDIGMRKQLFVDDKFIFRSQGVERTMNVPAKLNQPVLASDTPWGGEATTSIGWYSSVIKDGDKVRIWGSGKPSLPVRMTPAGPVVNLLAYAESTDGIHFTAPEPGRVSYDPSQAELGAQGRIGGVSVWIDPHGPSSQRYKTQAKFYPPGGRPAEFHMYGSPDGYCWTFLSKAEIGATDTQSVAFWDDTLQRYLLYTRDNPGKGTPTRRRVVRRLESDDLSHWTNEVYVMDADKVDNSIYDTPTPQPPVDFYGATVFKYPDDSPDSVYIMLAHAFWHWQRRPPEQRAGGYEDHKFSSEVLAPATLDDRLAVSRNGIQFQRLGDRRSFLTVGLSGSFSSKVAWALPNPIRMGDELWIYYCGDNRDHDGFVDPAADQHRLAIDRAILRLDGFVSADAVYTGGEITTPLLTFAGKRLTLNVDPGAGGNIRVELLDADDRPLAGYTLAEATPLHENSVCLPVTWQTNDSVAALAGQPIKIRFVMRDCKLYAFQFTDAF